MDYEKNKDAIAIVKQMIADGQVAQDVAERYFPELAESEDEIVISALKSGFKLLRREYKLIGLGGIKFEKILAWLEKRGEQKSTKEKLQALSDGKQHLGWLDDADKVIEEEQKSQRMVSAEAKEAVLNDKLSDFEEEFMAIVDSWCHGDGRVYNECNKQGIKDAQTLLSIARNQFLSEYYHNAEHYELAQTLESRYKARFKGYDENDYKIWAAQDAEVALVLAHKQIIANNALKKMKRA